jgi:quercetin dioxygenase-like cupin family protein
LTDTNDNQNPKDRQTMLKTYAPAQYERLDERGRFVEILAEGKWEAVIHGAMKPGSVMGNHYHLLTRVYFYLIRGQVTIDILRLTDGERRTYTLHSGKGMYLDQGVAHAIRFEEEGEFIVVKSRKYDPTEPDTYDFDVANEEAPPGFSMTVESLGFAMGSAEES